MIVVSYLTCNDEITHISVKGHAESGPYGQDLICAAVSSIVFGLMNALDDLKDEDLKIVQGANQITITYAGRSATVQDYFQVAMYQLKTIEASYGQHIHIERKEQSCDTF